MRSFLTLQAKTVGVQAASAALDVLKSEEEGGQKALSDTFAALNEFADYNTAFTELQAGALMRWLLISALQISDQFQGGGLYDPG